MLIIGAGGFARELLDVCEDLAWGDNLCFFDDVTVPSQELLYNKYPILHTTVEAEDYFKSNGNKFTIGIGNPLVRGEIYKKFTNLGAEFTTTVSPLAKIGRHDVTIGKGTNILPTAILSNSVHIGMGNIIYYGCIITHDVRTGDFVEISPNAKLLGNCEVGSYTSIGSNATILPKVKVGKNVIIGAGSVVTKDLPDDCTAVGIPAKIVKMKKR